jgi:hypothetical protein
LVLLTASSSVTEADSKKFDDISNANCDGNIALTTLRRV